MKTYKVEINDLGNVWANELGQYHREDGPAIEYHDGRKEWWLNGQLHRVDGPACEDPNGDKSWHQHGKLHREDGPAIDYNDGTKLWYYQGKLINCSSQEEFERLMKLKAFY